MPAPARQIPIPDIVAALAGRAVQLAGELLPAGRREGREWCVGSLAGEPGRSCKVHLEGQRAGVWSDFSTGETGDALDLVGAVLFGGDKGKAVRWSLAWLGWESADPAELEERRREAARPPVDEAAERAKEIKRACALWYHAEPSIRGTPVEAYLRDERGIDLARIGRQPGALRYHPQLWHWERMRDGRPIETYPAMIALVAGPDGMPVGVHRTYLQVHAFGRVTKLQGVEDAKLSKGPIRGGVIRLWRGLQDNGKRGHAWSHMPDGSHVWVSEGIEDGLSVVQADPSVRLVVGISLGNMTGLQWDARISRLSLVGQNDTNPKAIEATRRCLQAWAKQGPAVRRIVPPAAVKDVNDLLRGASDGEAAAQD